MSSYSKATRPSRSAATPGQRRVPSQERGRQRVAGFLKAATAVIEDVGYERATMSAIAARAGSSIGSLYQFFPNKPAVVEALGCLYLEDVDAAWLALAEAAPTLATGVLVRRLVGLVADIVKSHPVLLSLIDVPRTPHMNAQVERYCGLIVRVLLAHRRRMSRANAARIAFVTQQIGKGLLTLYAQADAREKPAIIRELKFVLTTYLTARLAAGVPRSGS